MSQPPHTPTGAPHRGQSQQQQQQQQQGGYYSPATAQTFTPNRTMAAPAPTTPRSDGRSRLNDDERKSRHSDSENKRRDKIRKAFERLSATVPGMDGHAASEAIVLHGAVSEIRRQEAIKQALFQRLVTEEGRMTAEQFAFHWQKVAAEGMANGESYQDDDDDEAPANENTGKGIKRERQS